MDTTGTIPSAPADESLAAYKAWLIQCYKEQGRPLYEKDFTESQWQQMHEDYWQNR